ncbi:MAG: hypothetical protein CL574_03395 [Altererythrobacter sp.]|nr:hypothetical protein [Altererythrobacter sp.]
MTKPASIKKFDYLYIGSVIVGLAGLMLGWDTLIQQMNAEFAAQGVAPEDSFASTTVITGVLMGTAISLALWFLISRLRIEFVKWIIALFTAWSVISVLTAIVTGSFNVSQISGIISTVMAVAAIYMLFQPDAKAWFAEKRGD